MRRTKTGSSTVSDPALYRRLFLVLAAVVLAYAFLAGLRTVADYDLGWQLATGRWVAQHHHVPSIDVLSYTAQGEPWIYPVGAGLVFYPAFLLGGYSLISWMGAAACVAAVALLLRLGSPVSAGIAILAVPLIAARTTPRADMFTVVFFAAFLSLLWENYQAGRAPLWLLPLLMVAWVNLHFGFAAGLGLILAYMGIELSEMVFPARRREAVQRLRRALPWFLATAAAALLNPWGWGIYRALILQQRATTQQQLLIAEWASVRLNWRAVITALSTGGTKGALFLLVAVAIVAAVLALLRAQLGAAIVLLGAIYPAVRYVRMGAVFSCIVVVIGGTVLSAAMAHAGSWVRRARTRSMIATAAVVLLAALAFARSVDLVTNRYYFDVITDSATFGAGLSWWFPRQAAEFIEREKLPGEIFNTYDEGGYLTWKLGPQRRVYIDGRDTLYGVPRIEKHRQLLQSSPDSDVWEQEASRYNINTIILSVARYDGIQFVHLKDFCTSKGWRPVYLDEISAVFVRRSPETEDLIQRLQVDCASAPLPFGSPSKDRARAFNQWANAASVLSALDRDPEALTATAKAISIFPGSAVVHMVRADLLSRMDRVPEAEQEYVTAVSLHPSEFTWSALADFYRKMGRGADAIVALKTATQLQPRPELTLVQLGYYCLQVGRPDDALEAFQEAVRDASPEVMKGTGRGSFSYNVATGRAAAWSARGDTAQATSFQEEAVRLAPDAPQPWLNLAKLYRQQGRSADADRAKARAAVLAENQNR